VGPPISVDLSVWRPIDRVFQEETSMTFRYLSVLLLCIASTVALGAQSPMRAGRWEVTTQMEMPNMPMKMPEMKSTQCVTPEQLKDPGSAVAGASSGPNGPVCKMSDYKTVGSTVSWKVACSAPQNMSGSGELTFVGDTYTGTTKMTMPQGEMTMKLSGKRLGDCTP
jgi:hypothetical protein